MIGPALRLAAAFKLSGNGDPLAVTRTPVIPKTSPLPTPPPAAAARLCRGIPSRELCSVPAA